jgi:hypothetical protein
MEQLKTEITPHTVKHVISVTFMIHNPPIFCELAELNVKYQDLVKLRRALVKEFGKDVNDIHLTDCAASISDKLKAH